MAASFRFGQQSVFRSCKRSSSLSTGPSRLLGSYEALEGGELADALIDFTGGLTECLEFNQTGTELRFHVTPDLLPSLNTPLDESKLSVSLSWCDASRQSATLLHPVPVWKNKTLCEYIYKLLLRHQLTKTLIASAISTDDPDGRERETELGLIVGHAYAVTRLCAVPTKRGADSGFFKGDSIVRLVRLMNPWGHGTWKGAFSEGSSDWDLVDQSFCHSICTNDSAENGEFWMRFEDFLRQFNYVVLCYTPMGSGSLSGDNKAWFQFIPSLRMAPPDVVCHADDGRLVVVPSEYGHSLESDRPSPLRLRELWTDFTIHSCWTNEMSGGCLNCADTFVNNPQFAFDVHRRPSTSLVICLFQKTERSPERLASTTGLHHIGMSVFRVEANRTVPIRSLNEPVHLVINSVYRNSRVVWLRLNCLPYGRYFVIPTTFYPNCLAEFMVRLVGSPPLLFFEIERTATRLASPVVRRSKSVLLSRFHGKKIKGSGAHFRHWITTRRTVSPLRGNMSDFFDGALLPPPNGNLRLTILQSVVWPPSTSFLARVFGKQLERIDERSLPPYYAHVSVNDQQASTGLYNLQLLKKGGGPGNSGLIQFRESFLFPKNNKGDLSFRFQLRIHHPVFDEVHSEYTGILDSSPGSDKSQPIIKHVPLFGRLGPNKSHHQTANYGESEHQPCRIVSDPGSSSPTDPVCLPAITKRQRAQSYRAAFQQSELLLLDAGCSRLLPFTSQTREYFSDNRCGFLTLSLEC
ncbi:Calpain-5, variant 2 [Clonorchis sinensis]|uniref:Calpain-5, variant 2 n=1 Tax=Clonorchis sinensis TaxID=79923 RepID=A0A8T1MSK2_CLOSI|nr:Calpain-5, variant 2 [Clonorchis sinensis]